MIYWCLKGKTEEESKQLDEGIENIKKYNDEIDKLNIELVAKGIEEERKAKLNIQDLTTYIDQVKLNHVFVQNRLDSQNFWVKIGVKNIARRLISAKQIPTLSWLGNQLKTKGGA